MNTPDLKTYLCSISAVCLAPGVIVKEDRKVLLCEVDREVNPSGEFVVGVAQLPLLMIEYEREEAEESALRRARETFPPADGWINHTSVLIELPPSTFVKVLENSDPEPVEDQDWSIN